MNISLMVVLLGCIATAAWLGWLLWGTRPLAPPASYTLPQKDSLPWVNFTRLLHNTPKADIAFGWRGQAPELLRAYTLTQISGVFFCGVDTVASNRTLAALTNQVPDNVLLSPQGQVLIWSLAHNLSREDCEYGPEDLGALTLLASDLFSFVAICWREEGVTAKNREFQQALPAWMASFLTKSGRERRSLRADLAAGQDIEQTALLYYAYGRARSLMYSQETGTHQLPADMLALLVWLYRHFHMLQEMERARHEFKPISRPDQLRRPEPEPIEELPAGAMMQAGNRTLGILPTISSPLDPPDWQDDPAFREFFRTGRLPAIKG